jgi:hypothetical protein
MWIVKPYASSRGAGITIIQNLTDFYQTSYNKQFHYKNQRKYG